MFYTSTTVPLAKSPEPDTNPADCARPSLSGDLLHYARRHVQMTPEQVAQKATCPPSLVTQYEQANALSGRPYLAKIAAVIANHKDRNSQQSPIDRRYDYKNTIRAAIRSGRLTLKDHDLVLAIEEKRLLPEVTRHEVIAALRLIAGDGIVIEKYDGCFQIYQSSPERLRECLLHRISTELICMSAVLNGSSERKERVIQKMAHVLIQMWEAIHRDVHREIKHLLHLDNQFHLSWADGSGEIASALDSFLFMPRVNRENNVRFQNNHQSIRRTFKSGFHDLHSLWLELRQPRPDEARMSTLLCQHIVKSWKTIDIPFWLTNDVVYKCRYVSAMTADDESKPHERLLLATNFFARWQGEVFWKCLEEFVRLGVDLPLPPRVPHDIPDDNFRKRFQIAIAGWVGPATIRETDDMLLSLKADLAEDSSAARAELLTDVLAFHRFFRRYTLDAPDRTKLERLMLERNWSIHGGRQGERE